ncbi:hypothetical protein Glove_606g158 [Diversispora epigaea]|uniref:Uncharacterized protein n=1 Tax=Diversispora epigaea TaxID=1348612 RepID=A0A397G8C7_9GLOM|nr:hypothetical protein Glove_606g158 [Diversispora epigaea]
MNHREKGNKAFVNGGFEIARQEHTKGIEVPPEGPRLWSNRAQPFIKFGGWRKAEALAKSDEYGSAAVELERLSQIVNRRTVAGVDWNAWEREQDRYFKKHSDIMLLKNMGSD